MRSFLLQPYPFSENLGRKLALCVGIGIFVALFLGVFKPFGFDQLPLGTGWLHAGLFGAVTAVVSTLLQLIVPLVFPLLFREEGWRSWKEILYLLVTTAAIGAGNFWLSLKLYGTNINLHNFLHAEVTALQVGVFPVLFVVFLKQMTLYRRFAAEAKEVTEDIQHTEAPAQTIIPLPPALKITLRGDNQKEELSLSPDDLLFIASADNYVNVHYREGGKLKSVLLRGSLKKAEDQLTGMPTFFRCHRMYLVNLQAVTDVSGNAQGLKLHIPGIKDAIPVSRSLTETVKEKLHHLSRSPQNA